jgi:hypothetical protein
VPHYRIYFLNDAGQSYRSLELDCSDEASAMLSAEGQAGGRAMELWADARVVKSYPARRKSQTEPA